MLDFLASSKRYRMGEMLKTGPVRSRLENGLTLSFSEFAYQVLQSNDWLKLYETHDCLCQVKIFYMNDSLCESILPTVDWRFWPAWKPRNRLWTHSRPNRSSFAGHMLAPFDWWRWQQIRKIDHGKGGNRILAQSAEDIALLILPVFSATSWYGFFKIVFLGFELSFLRWHRRNFASSLLFKTTWGIGRSYQTAQSQSGEMDSSNPVGRWTDLFSARTRRIATGQEMLGPSV